MGCLSVSDHARVRVDKVTIISDRGDTIPCELNNVAEVNTDCIANVPDCMVEADVVGDIIGVQRGGAASRSRLKTSPYMLPPSRGLNGSYGEAYHIC